MVAQQAQLDAGTIEGWLPRSCLIYVTDTRYLPLTLTSLLTASRTMPASMDAIIYLDDVPAPVRDEAMAFLRDWGVPAHLIDFEIDSLFTDTARIPLWREGISRAGFARLGLCAAPDGYETHVVLDGDTLVGGDMTELVSVRPTTFAAVRSSHSRKGWEYLYCDRGMPIARDYFNAGLMVINASMWRDEGIAARCMSLVEDRSTDGLLDRPMRDQEILNLIFGNTFHRRAFRRADVPLGSARQPQPAGLPPDLRGDVRADAEGPHPGDRGPGAVRQEPAASAPVQALAGPGQPRLSQGLEPRARVHGRALGVAAAVV
jgi:hypothetical protein